MFCLIFAKESAWCALKHTLILKRPHWVYDCMVAWKLLERCCCVTFFDCMSLLVFTSELLPYHVLALTFKGPQL